MFLVKTIGNQISSAVGAALGLDEPTRLLVGGRDLLASFGRVMPAPMKRLGLRLLLSPLGSRTLRAIYADNLPEVRRTLSAEPWLKYFDALEHASPGICIRLYVDLRLFELPAIARLLKLARAYRGTIGTKPEKRADALGRLFVDSSHYIERLTSTVLLAERIRAGEAPIVADPALMNLLRQYNEVATVHALPLLDPEFVDVRNARAHNAFDFSPRTTTVHMRANGAPFERSLDQLQALLDAQLATAEGCRRALELRFHEFLVALCRETGLGAALEDSLQRPVTPASHPELVREIDARFAPIAEGHLNNPRRRPPTPNI